MYINIEVKKISKTIAPLIIRIEVIKVYLFFVKIPIYVVKTVVINSIINTKNKTLFNCKLLITLVHTIVKHKNRFKINTFIGNIRNR